MISIADRVILAFGWRRGAIAFLAGAVGALAMPPLGLWPVLAVSMTIAVWLIDGATAAPGRFADLRSAAVAGWWFGFGYFLAGLWWLGSAFLVEADQFAWALPLGVVGLPAGLALFHAAGFALARLLWSPGPWRIFALAAGLSSAEWLRGHLLTGFPWNGFGLALGDAPLLDQGAALMGLHGLTLVAVATLAAPATLGTGRGVAGRWALPVAAVALLAELAAWGAWRVPAAAHPTVAGVRLRIMQPNVAQDAKFRPENREAIMRHYLALSDRATSPEAIGIADVTHLVWPESAFPFLLDRDAAALEGIAAFLPPGTVLVTGAARAEPPREGETRARFFNAVQVLDDEGRIQATYDKTHLVPFGEYLPGPLRTLIEAVGLREFVRVPGGFEPGARRGLLRVPGLPPAAAVICYEAIFPGAVVPAGGVRPGLLLNVTNDAWFGLTPGPHQHLAQARMRAIEEGLPLVRAANNGVSAVIDPYGRTLRSLPLGAEGVLDAGLPESIGLTPYARLGDGVFGAMVVGVLLLAFAGRRARSPRPASALR